jgi:hypothetical protein
VRRFAAGLVTAIAIVWAIVAIVELPVATPGHRAAAARGPESPLHAQEAAGSALPAAAEPPPGHPYFASPDGSAANPGTTSEPLDLATALSSASPAKPGDTVWLLGGTYHGPFVSDVAGTAAAPIQVRQYPGQRAILDGSAAPAVAPLTVNGADTWFRDFEVTNTNPDRSHERGIGVNVFGARVRLLNLVIHDTGNGVGLWSPAVDSELSGNVIFDVGWAENNEGKGHSIYVQNETGTKHIDRNILFDGYAYGIHAYTERGHIDNLDIEGNVSFGHGILSPAKDLKANILVGGWRTAEFPRVIGNFLYDPPGTGGRGLQLGYWAGCDGAIVRNNYVAGDTPINLRWCSNVSMSGNRFLGNGVDGDIPEKYPDNTFGRPDEGSGPDVFVQRNRYDPGRATIVVFNWQRQATVAVDPARLGFQPGDRFRVIDAQNYFGAPAADAEYRPDAPLTLPMTLTSVWQPIGGPHVTHTSPEFAVFVVQRAR